MSRPTRVIVPGAAYYLTVVTHGRRRIFRNPDACHIVLDALAFQRHQSKMRLFAYVVMPDHLHWLCLPVETCTPGDLIRDFKTFTAKALRAKSTAAHDSQALAAFAFAAVTRRHQAYKVWQDGSWVRPILGIAPLHACVAYLHANPVRAGLVAAVSDYRWSSAAVNLGLGDGAVEVDPLPT